MLVNEEVAARERHGAALKRREPKGKVVTLVGKIMMNPGEGRTKDESYDEVAEHGCVLFQR